MADQVHRRWLRFNLRTLLIAFTIIGLGCGWLAWNANLVRQRKMALSELRLRKESQIVHVYSPYDVRNWENLPPRKPPVSALREWLGDRSIGLIRFQPGTPQSELDAVGELFPEAHIDRYIDPDLLMKPFTK